ncbi:MAG: ASKHA domain-containing protein [Deltaproteobacteria bacterium]
MGAKFTVTFFPERREVVVDAGTTLLAAALSAQVPLASNCGGEGVCGKCRVRVTSGKVEGAGRPPAAPGVPADTVLACQALVVSDVNVEVPPESRLEETILDREETGLRCRGFFDRIEEAAPQEASEAEAAARTPLVVKVYLELPPPDLNDRLSDFERVCREVETKTGMPVGACGLSNIRELGPLLRSSGWKVTATVLCAGDDARVMAIEAGDRTAHHYGVVFDIGTTTISAELVDIARGCVLATKVTYNRQARFGSDVITRIIYAQAPDGLERLHAAVTAAMNEMIDAFCAERGVDVNDISAVSVAGNTTMIHLLLKIDPRYIRQEPYVPVANIVPRVRAADAGIKIGPHGVLVCAPGVSSYVGGDITAGVLACGMHRRPAVQVLIDIGTNGEIALGNDDWMISCAASAGPAFEGSGMSCGLRAVRGAVQSCSIDPGTFETTLGTIGAEKPRGICGSGYIDLLRALLAAQLLDKNGRFREAACARLRRGPDGPEFVVAWKKDAAGERDIVITEADIDNLKRAKAAIYSGLATLLRHMDMTAADVERIYLAGGFGTALDIESAVQIGLVPDMDRNKFVFKGNTSLAGARLRLLHRDLLKETEAVAANTTYFELSADPEYMDEYMAALFFPHTDTQRFPTAAYARQK